MFQSQDCGLEYSSGSMSHLNTFSSAALRLRLDATENSSRRLEPGGSRFASSVMYGTLSAQCSHLGVRMLALSTNRYPGRNIACGLRWPLGAIAVTCHAQVRVWACSDQ